MVELAKLRQLSQECSRQDRTYARHAPQQHLVLLEGGVRGDSLVEIFVGPFELLLEPLDVCLDAPGYRFGAILRQFFSAMSISKSWRLLARIACKAWASSSGRMLG